MSKKIVSVSIPTEIYTNFLLNGTVIDRPGLPLLKIIGASPITEDKVNVNVEVSPYSRKKINKNKGEL